MQVVERLRREALRPGSLDPRLVKPLIFALKVAGQNARHTTFDGAGLRNRFVTELPRAEIPAPAAARKNPGPSTRAPSASAGSVALAQDDKA